MAAEDKSKSKSGAKSKRGGRRKNAGRKPNAAKAIRQKIIHDKGDVLASVEESIVDFLPRAIANMMLLANGGYQRVEEKWTRDPIPDRPGVQWDIPEEPALVLTERKVSMAEPDRGANQYLIDRALGKAIQRLEHDFGDLTDEELVARAKGLFKGDGPPRSDAPAR